MERLTTASDLLKKYKRLSEFQTNAPLVEVSFDIGFYMGMNAHNKFMNETSLLELEDGLEQLNAMETEVNDFLKKME